MSDIKEIVKMIDQSLEKLPNLPCKMDEMTQREYEISHVGSECVGLLIATKSWLEKIDDDNIKRIEELENAIRKHRSATGHNMCWENDEELWVVLKDNIEINHKPPGWCKFITNCIKYRASKDKNEKD